MLPLWKTNLTSHLLNSMTSGQRKNLKISPSLSRTKLDHFRHNTLMIYRRPLPNRQNLSEPVIPDLLGGEENSKSRNHRFRSPLRQHHFQTLLKSVNAVSHHQSDRANVLRPRALGINLTLTLEDLPSTLKRM